MPGKSHGWRSLVGCSPWGRYESDAAERLHFHFSLSCTGEGYGNPLQCFDNFGLQVFFSCFSFSWNNSLLFLTVLVNCGLCWVSTSRVHVTLTPTPSDLDSPMKKDRECQIFLMRIPEVTQLLQGSWINWKEKSTVECRGRKRVKSKSCFYFLSHTLLQSGLTRFLYLFFYSFRFGPF